MPGRKNPLLIFENHKFIAYERKAGKTVWRCSYLNYNSCPTRIWSQGKSITIFCEPHKHAPTIMEIPDTTPYQIVSVKRITQ